MTSSPDVKWVIKTLIIGYINCTQKVCIMLPIEL